MVRIISSYAYISNNRASNILFSMATSKSVNLALERQLDDPEAKRNDPGLNMTRLEHDLVVMFSV